jgi:hypothetical protein
MRSYSNKSILIILAFCVFAANTLAQSSQSRRNPNSIVQSADKPLNILSQPEPELTDEQRKQIEGKVETIQLRVEFLDSGFIGAINPLNTLPFGLTEAAIDAASKIMFEPERKNTKRVTVYKIIEYSFNQEKKVVDDVAPENVAKAEAIIKKAIETLGGQRYLQVTSQIGRGKFSQMREGRNLSFQSFTDVIIYPNKEYTEFKERGIKTAQANFVDSGWHFDGALETLTDQTPVQIDGFKRAMRTNLDNFLRGVWRGKEAQLRYVERRQASLGKRNEVVKLSFDDGFWIEFEFSDEGFPMKSVYSRIGADRKEIFEEDRFAQFIEVQGIKVPYVIDHFTGGEQTSRINYESVEFNKSIPDSIFQKPNNIKALKKDLKL